MGQCWPIKCVLFSTKSENILQREFNFNSALAAARMQDLKGNMPKESRIYLEKISLDLEEEKELGMELG
jgi:hypothetical protein